MSYRAQVCRSDIGRLHSEHLFKISLWLCCSCLLQVIEETPQDKQMQSHLIQMRQA